MPQVFRVEDPATLNHPPDLLCVADIFKRVRIQQDDIGKLAGFQRAEIRFRADSFGSLNGCTSQYITRRQSRLNQELQLPVKRGTVETAEICSRENGLTLPPKTSPS